MATTDGENRGRKSDIAVSDFRRKGVREENKGTRGRVAVSRVVTAHPTIFAKLGYSQFLLFT